MFSERIAAALICLLASAAPDKAAPTRPPCCMTLFFLYVSLFRPYHNAISEEKNPLRTNIILIGLETTEINRNCVE
jgi:hypothetical protein